jgi:hypothetical protein
MERSRDKSLFLHHERDIWDHLVEEAWLHGELVVQLTAAHEKVVELTPTGEELANLRIREANAIGTSLRLKRRPRP